MMETTVIILGKTYQIKCPVDAEESLRAAAQYLEEKMQEARDNGTLGLDRIAVIAGLNIAYQLLNFENHKQEQLNEINQRLQALQQKVDGALGIFSTVEKA